MICLYNSGSSSAICSFSSSGMVIHRTRRAVFICGSCSSFSTSVISSSRSASTSNNISLISRSSDIGGLLYCSLQGRKKTSITVALYIELAVGEPYRPAYWAPVELAVRVRRGLPFYPVVDLVQCVDDFL